MGRGYPRGRVAPTGFVFFIGAHGSPVAAVWSGTNDGYGREMSGRSSTGGSEESPFLSIPTSEWLASNRSGFAVLDRYPVSEGQSLVISRRLIADWWEAYPEEQADRMALVAEVKRLLDQRHSPAGSPLPGRREISGPA